MLHSAAGLTVNALLFLVDGVTTPPGNVIKLRTVSANKVIRFTAEGIFFYYG